MSGKGYLDADGNEHVLKGDDALNAFQAQQQQELPWISIQSEAIVLSRRLLQLFTGSGLVTPEVLDSSRKFHWKYPDGIEISLTCGWFLWMVSLEHEAVEHSADLGIL